MNKDSNDSLYQYAGLGAQLLVGLGLAAFAGLWIDRKLHAVFPFLVWLLPLIVLVAMIYKAVKDTSSKK